MGKKFKKPARNNQKEKRFPTTSPKIVSQEIIPATNTAAGEEVSVTEETQTCPHLDTGINFKKFCLRISALKSKKCEDCRKGVADQKPKKGKNNHGKNKPDSSKPEPVWVCLECGHFSCGGIGLSTTPQSHAARHSKQYRHPLVIQFANPSIRWCFSCSTVIPVQSSAENGEQKDNLSDFVDILKARSSSSRTHLNVEDFWFGRGSVTSEVKSVYTLPVCLENGSGFMVRGLMNLGNTCFFNSVLQNLLAMDKLWDYLLNLDGPVGPLTMSLKQLFIETSPSTGMRNVINPGSFLRCICVKAPQFKGFQQHDSHELLRCLLDGLSTEESCVQKQKRSQYGNNSDKNVPTFVDDIFGGQISSTVSCLECGHASVVYEPYLDLSLPLPTKKVPSKKISSVSRSKKPNFPPKRQGKFRSKPKNISESLVAHDVTDTLTSESTNSIKENATTSGDSIQSESVVFDAVGDRNDSGLLNGTGDAESAILSNSHDKATVDESNVTPLLDHCELTMVSNGHDTDTQFTDVSVADEAVQSTMEANAHADSIDLTSWLDYLEPSTSTAQDTSSNTHNSSVIQDSGNRGNDVKLSYATYEQEPSECDGFGGLFNEPELDAGPTVNPLSNGVKGNGVMATSNSELDPDAVDDTDSSLSVEKCLAYFTTTELLMKTEHAWQCEKCAKSLLAQRARQKKELQNSVINGHNNGISNGSSDSGIEHLLPNGSSNPYDRSAENADLVLHNGKSDSHDTESCSVNGPTDRCKNENVQKNESDSSEDEEVDSKSVKVARDASKRILISKAPRVLTIHLKRFCQDARGRLSKINGHVNFGETVDLRPYMDPSCCKDRETYKYRLMGVVEHSGTMRGGHYVAYVKRGAKGTGADDDESCFWYHASDAYVCQTSLEEVLRCEAYILFYEEL